MSRTWTSPNHGDRKGHSVSMAVLHYTGMQSAEEALERLCDVEAQVSAHYVIEEDGRVHALVPEDRRAWHAGVSVWGADTDINSVSVGFEIVNPGHEWGYRPFPAAQISALIPLLRGTMERHGIPPARVVGHSDVAPGRKEDPGELFPWAQLAGEGLAIGPWSGEGHARVPNDAEAAKLLTQIGYGVEAFGLEPSIEAFQRRFVPAELGQGMTEATRAALAEAAPKFED